VLLAALTLDLLEQAIMCKVDGLVHVVIDFDDVDRLTAWHEYGNPAFFVLPIANIANVVELDFDLNSRAVKDSHESRPKLFFGMLAQRRGEGHVTGFDDHFHAGLLAKSSHT